MNIMLTSHWFVSQCSEAVNMMLTSHWFVSQCSEAVNMMLTCHWFVSQCSEAVTMMLTYHCCLCQCYEAAVSGNDDVTVTRTCDNLKCQHVFHLRLHKLRDGTYQVIMLINKR